MIRQAMLLAIPALLLSVPGAWADSYDFSYSGAGGIFGSGAFTTGTPYGDGYVPIMSITGTTEAGAILGLEESDGPGIDPNDPNAPLECCAVGPNSGDFFYDNAFLPADPNNPFTAVGGLLFDVANGVDSPVELFGDGAGNTYEFSYGEDVGSLVPPAFGGTQVSFTAILTPEPGTVALCMSGLLFVRWRLRRG